MAVIFCFGSHRGIRTPVTAVRGRRPEPLDDMALAAGPGFEPGQHDPESWVLPLHNPAISLVRFDRQHFKNLSNQN